MNIFFLTGTSYVGPFQMSDQLHVLQKSVANPNKALRGSQRSSHIWLPQLIKQSPYRMFLFFNLYPKIFDFLGQRNYTWVGLVVLQLWKPFAYQGCVFGFLNKNSDLARTAVLKFCTGSMVSRQLHDSFWRQNTLAFHGTFLLNTS